MTLDTSIQTIPRIGPKFQKKLKKMGIKTVEDLLWHFPHRYEDFSNVCPIAQLTLNEKCCIMGKILEIKNSRTWRKRMILTQTVVEDKTGAIKVVWFNQPYLIKTLRAGDGVCLAGKVSLGNDGIFLSNPAYEKLPKDVVRSVGANIPDSILTHTGRLVPVYPETEGLSSRWLRYIIKSLLGQFKNVLTDVLPPQVIKEHKLLPINQAIEQVHFPVSMAMAEKAKQRFSFEELFFIELFVLRERGKLAREKSVAIPLNLELIQKFVKTLPFKLTDAQKKSSWQILKDLEKPRPMNRLLEGDVGSGKTVVAVMAALNVFKAGFQIGFMAPTEILAKQHFQEVAKLLADFKVNIGLLTGKEDKFISKKLKREPIEISREKLLKKTKDAEIDILIGTHALIQDKVKFGRLGLVILDEQHRFGVGQRAKLCQHPMSTSDVDIGCQQTDRRVDIGCQQHVPHLLSMTATPIPRTLALTIYGDLDLSLIDEMPKGRKKIITKVVAPANRQKAYDFIRDQVNKGRQVFVICPRIEGQSPEESVSKSCDRRILTQKGNVLSWAEAKAVKEEYEKLDKEVFPDLKIEMLHGRLAAKEKEKIMKDFRAKKTDILVSTSVIEVGIDVPNASVMMIEGAERFGLAQLHQFRGRVGRAEHQSFCFLFTDSPAQRTRQRLRALIDCENGFDLAEKDLKIRGPGDFSGTRQWGIPDLVMASLTDLSLVEKTREAAKELLVDDPGLRKYPLLLKKLSRFGQRVHLE